jgi:fibronectin type 3 domain-containing protein
MTYICRLIAVILVLFLWPAAPALTQERPPQVRVLASAEGDEVYVYHTLTPPLGHGVHVYRQIDGGDFEPLTDEPLYGAQRGTEVISILGDRYETVRQAVSRDNPLSVLVALRQDRVAADIMTFVYPEVATLLGRRFVDRTAPVGSRVTYRVQIVDDLENPVGQPLQTAVQLERHTPGSPSGLEATFRRGIVDLTWSMPPPRNASEENDLVFHVYQSGGDSIPDQRLNELPLLRSTDNNRYSFFTEGPTEGESATYYVVLADFVGQYGSPSNEVTVVGLDDVPPPPPVEISARAIAGSLVEVTWSAADAADLAGYHLYRSTNALEGYERIGDEMLPASIRTYTETPPRLRQTFFYRVTAVDAAGNESIPGPLAFVQVQPSQPPPPPAGLEATYDRATDRVDLRWQSVQHGPGFWTYVIMRRRIDADSGPSFAQANIEDVRDFSFSDSGESARGFVEGVRYRYAIVAADSVRNYSDTMFVDVKIPDLTPPDPPTTLQALVTDGFRADVSWSASPSGDVTSYRVHRRVGPDADFAPWEVVPSNIRSLRDEDLSVGTVYAYFVTAVDSAGNESVRSDLATLAVAPPSPPQSVRNLTAEMTAAGVALRWEAVPSPHLSGYRIYRSDTATGNFIAVNETLVESTTWVDASGSTDHWYEVRAVDIAGSASRSASPARVHSPGAQRR